MFENHEDPRKVIRDSFRKGVINSAEESIKNMRRLGCDELLNIFEEVINESSQTSELAESALALLQIIGSRGAISRDFISDTLLAKDFLEKLEDHERVKKMFQDSIERGIIVESAGVHGVFDEHFEDFKNLMFLALQYVYVALKED